MVLINWDMHRWETEFVFSDLKDYLGMIESQFEIAREIERTRTHSNPPSRVSEDDFSEWQAEIEFFEERYDRDFPSKIRYSFVVLLHIELENRLRATCDEISRRKNIVIREKDLKGSPIERAKTFLDKIAMLSLNNQQAWQGLKDLQNIRDCIVHTNGQIEASRDKKRLLELCEKRLGIANLEGTLMIKNAYCIKAIEAIAAYFDNLFDSAGFGSSTLTTG
jgi:hypothetical protein